MKLNFYTYSLPFSQPFKTASQNFTHRPGFLLELEKDNVTGLGEVAPLPGFSSENRDDVINQLQSKYRPIADFFNSDFTLAEVQEFTIQHRFYHSVQFGLLTLGAMFLAQKKQCVLNDVLQSPVSKIPINAVAGAQPEHLADKAQGGVDNGFNTLKVKVAGNWDHQFSQLKKIRRQYPNLNIRIDANQSWSLQEAHEYLNDLEELAIEYCEEPLRNPDEKTLRKLIAHTSVPLALDESIGTVFGIEKAMNLAPVLIIKPMVLGTTALKQISKNEAPNKGSKLVFTSSLEGSIGRLMTAALAGKYGTAGTAHGLNTGAMLGSDFWRDDRCISDGFYHIPKTNLLTDLIKTMNTSMLQPFEL